MLPGSSDQGSFETAFKMNWRLHVQVVKSAINFNNVVRRLLASLITSSQTQAKRKPRNTYTRWRTTGHRKRRAIREPKKKNQSQKPNSAQTLGNRMALMLLVGHLTYPFCPGSSLENTRYYGRCSEGSGRGGWGGEGAPYQECLRNVLPLFCPPERQHKRRRRRARPATSWTSPRSQSTTN